MSGALANKNRAAAIMRRMGFPDDASGFHIDQLRRRVREQVEGGLVSRSAGTWGPEAATLSLDDRAREFLSLDWELDNGHSARVDLFDGLRHWRQLPTWLGDRRRLFLMRARILRDRIFGRRNPYRPGSHRE